MKTKISLIAIFCLLTMTGWARSERVLRIISGGEVLQEYKAGEFDAVEYHDSETLRGEINGYEYVDLGLPSGLKWATCNVGANTPEEYGYYFQWGESEPKENYTAENCSTFGLALDLNNISGHPVYDTARVNCGSTWRMPTKEEAEELFDICDWQDGFLNGVAGMKVTGPNGNYIFMPYTGHCYGAEITGAGTAGYFWFSDVQTKTNGNNAYYAGYAVRSYDADGIVIRYIAKPVRPVSD